MSRLTISLNDELHQALKETAVRQRRTIASIVEESLRYRGVRSQADARALVAAARQSANLTSEDAMDIALTETRSVRQS